MHRSELVNPNVSGARRQPKNTALPKLAIEHGLKALAIPTQLLSLNHSLKR